MSCRWVCCGLSGVENACFLSADAQSAKDRAAAQFTLIENRAALQQKAGIFVHFL